MQGSVVLVAGASGSTGRAIALKLLEAGADVMMLGGSLETLAAHGISPARLSPRYVAVDLTDSVAVSLLGAEISDKGRFDALVLNSGPCERSQAPEALRRQMEANLLGPYALIQAVRPVLIRSGGQVVFINSIQALRAAANAGQYAATKQATKAIADSLLGEVNERGIRVTSLYLGQTAGNRQRELFDTDARTYRPERLIQPDDVALTVLQVLQMARTIELTDIMMRPMLKS